MNLPKGVGHYDIRLTSLVVVPHDQPSWSEAAITVSLVDDGGGEFLEVSQSDGKPGTLRIDPDEWSTLRKTIGYMMRKAR